MAWPHSKIAPALPATEIAAAVRIGADFFRRNHRLDISEDDIKRIAGLVHAVFDDSPNTELTRRSLTEEIIRHFQALRDASDMQAIGAVPMMEGKLHPIEDEI